MTRIVVGTADLRAALTAVRGHVPKGAEAPYAWVRGTVAGPNLELSATNSHTSMAIAIVSIIENETGEAGAFDLLPSEVAELLLAFKGRGASGDGDDVGPTLRIHTSGGPSPSLRVTDVSGFWPGKSISFPRASLDPGDFPDVAGVFGRLLARSPKAPDRVVTHGPALASFAKAGTAYGEPLIIESVSDTGRTLLISCGESFLGLLLTSDLDEDRQVKVKEWREAWSRRLPAAGGGRS